MCYILWEETSILQTLMFNSDHWLESQYLVICESYKQLEKRHDYSVALEDIYVLYIAIAASVAEQSYEFILQKQ